MAENNGIRVLERALSILDYMADSKGRSGITSIAETTGLPKATVYRIMHSLSIKNVVLRNDDGTYTMGPAVLTWADTFQAGVALPKLAQSVLQELWKASKETVHLTAYEGGQAFYVDKLASPHPVGMRSRVGASLCLYTTAAGRAILASLSSEELQRYLETVSWEPRTEKSVSGKEALMQLLDSVRAQGYALENEENETGIRCIGAAILQGKEVRPVGAVSLSVPAYRMEESRVPFWGEAVRKAAQHISALLGGTE